MAEYEGLTLDRGKIDKAIRSFPGLKSVTGPTEGKGFNSYTIEVEGQLPGLLQVFERNDCLITLKFKLGKNRTLSEQLALHVADTCKMEREQTKPLSLKFISVEDWEFLKESLSEDGFSLDAEANALAERFKVTGPGKDHIWIHRYNTGAFLMQGRTRNAYSAVVHCLSYTKTEQKELIESQLSIMPVTDVDCQSLMCDLEQRLPTAWPLMDETVKTILAPALLVHNLSVDLPDYSLMVFPALRGMEGCIKDIFGKRGHFLGAKLSIGDQFDPRTKKVTSAIRDTLGCGATCSAAEEIYNHFSKHRNGLLHVDSVLETTRIIEKQAEAAEIIDSAFHVIEKAYSSIP